MTPTIPSDLPVQNSVNVRHLKKNKKQANTKLNVSWNGVNLECVENLVYLGKTLNCLLMYKGHCEKTRKKASA